MIYSSVINKPAQAVSDAIKKQVSGFSVVFSNFYGNLFDRLGVFVLPEFNLLKVRDALNAESIFRRVVDKYQEQIWKNGWKFKSKSSENVKYIDRRFKEIAEVTQIPTQILLERISRQIIQNSNCFIAKVRDKNASTGMERINLAGKKLKPVAGYFVQPAEYMQIRRNSVGKITGYKLEVDGQVSMEWDPEDMIHLTMHLQEGYSFGTPMIVPVLNDIAALRRVEQSSNVLVFQHAIPILHFLVGDEDETGTKDEIADLNQKITQMSVYGHLVTTNRVKVDVVGSGRESIDLTSILEYWKTRVLSGLGISSVGMGEADTSNRGTATTVVSEFQSTSASFQRAIILGVNEYMIKELLAEKGLNPLRITDAQMVCIHMPEIDLQNKISQENQIVFLYEHDAITEDEMRYELGREPISESQRDKMHLDVVTIPKAMASKGVVDGEFMLPSPETTNKVKPTNQHGTKTSPSRAKND